MPYRHNLVPIPEKTYYALLEIKNVQ